MFRKHVNSPWIIYRIPKTVCSEFRRLIFIIHVQITRKTLPLALISAVADYIHIRAGQREKRENCFICLRFGSSETSRRILFSGPAKRVLNNSKFRGRVRISHAKRPVLSRTHFRGVHTPILLQYVCKCEHVSPGRVLKNYNAYTHTHSRSVTNSRSRRRFPARLCTGLLQYESLKVNFCANYSNTFTVLLLFFYRS